MSDLRLIREEESPRPSTRLSRAEGPPSIAANRSLEPKKLSGLVRGELDWIVMKTLEKDRNRRYETANGLAADVLRYLNDETVLACPPSAWYRIRKMARRNKGAFAIASAITLFVLVMVAGLASSTIMVSREQKATEDALHAETRAKDHLEKSRHSHRDLLYLHRIALADRFWLSNDTGRAVQSLDECPESLRRWEWNFLRRTCPSEVFTFPSLTQQTRFLCAALSPDGRSLAAGSNADGV